MTITHTVKQGDHLSGIAHQHGFGQIEPIWLHADNAALRQKRKYPHILMPGDEIVIPDKLAKSESAPTEGRHAFRARGKPLYLRFTLQEFDGSAITNEPCTFRVELDRHDSTTDEAGNIDVAIPVSAKQVTLTIQDLEMRVRIAHLDPITERSGQKGRLSNLGYYAGGLDDNDEPAYRSAVEEFQCDHELKVDGICGPQTQAKLEKVYGC